MTEDDRDEIITDTINNFTQKVSEIILKEFLELPKDLQLSIVLIKSTQLMLANILCQVAMDNEELQLLVEDQGIEVKELTLNCAATAFADKFDMGKH